MRKLLFTFLLTSLFSMARGQTSAYYWFDSQNGPATKAPVTSGIFTVDASLLSDGLHTLYCQLVKPDGSCSQTERRSFIRISPISRFKCLCYVDGTLYSQQMLDATDGVAAWEADLASVPVGMHLISIQAVLPDGTMSNIHSGMVLRTGDPVPPTLRCSYSIDGNVATQGLGVVEPGGVCHFDLDVASLADGLHHITYCISGSDGSSAMQTRLFVKIPVGGNKMTMYQYWVNDNVDQMRSTTLDEPQNPLQVVQLLPVESCPLRSRLFHFEFNEGQPMMYAKNTLHARFYDLTGHFGELEENYVDYAVSASVTPAGILTSGVRETTDWPETNTVKWYTLEAQQGDSLRLKLDRAATIQLFAPSGDEVYSANGASSVKWGGLHAEESGTFYLALHDVTATKGSNISIDYQRIDRYAVLKQDVTKVGNGGSSTITFQGNGFDELLSVDLVLGDATISSTAVTAESKAVAAVKFNFDGAELGQYKAVFHFTGGDLTVEKCVTVENVVPVSLQPTVKYPKQFLLSAGNNYVYKMKNLGNMTAYNVPITVKVYTPSKASLNLVDGKGCTLGNYTEDTDNGDIEGCSYMRQYTISQTLRPSSTETFTIHVKTTETVYVYVQGDDVVRTGGPSTPVASLDPNDIYGYEDGNGDKTIRNGQTQVYYTIEFENDPEFATAPAHDIYVTDVLSPELFDLSTFAPTRVKVGSHEVELDGSKNGTTTFSMLPDVYAIAQLDWSLDETTGTVSWHISSLDPMTVESTEALSGGVLPVNQDGNGIGELSFDIELKPNLPDGTEIPNKATIVFDENEPIETPTWVNTISTADVQMGDVNGDGEINAQDASLIQQYVARKFGDDAEGFNAAAADVNGDGEVTAQDASLVQQYAARKITW